MLCTQRLDTNREWDREAFRDKPFIRDRHRRSCNCQRGGQFSRGRQPLSRPQAPVQNGLPNSAVDLAAEVSSTNTTDVKSYNPGSIFLCNGPATQHKGERSIIPLLRCGDGNRKFLEREAYQMAMQLARYAADVQNSGSSLNA